MTIFQSAIVAAPALIFLTRGIGLLEQLKRALTALQIAGWCVRLAAVDVWRDRMYYWRRAQTVASERR